MIFFSIIVDRSLFFLFLSDEFILYLFHYVMFRFVSFRFIFQMSSPAAQQFLLLAKSVRGSAAVELTNRIFEHEDIFGFDEFLRLEVFVNSLKQDHPEYLSTLQLFAYGTLKDYETNRTNFIPLTSLARRKLQLLTLASLAAHARILSYKILLQQLEIQSIRDLEDLIIDAIYAQVIRGKLDQLNHLLYIEYAIARDVNDQSLQQMEDVLDKWCNNCSSLLNVLKAEAQKANNEKKKKTEEQEKYDKEMLSMLKIIDIQGQEALAAGKRDDSQHFSTVQFDPKQGGAKKPVRPTAKRNLQS